MTENIIFQAMDDDYVDHIPLAELESVIRNAESLAVDNVYHFNIHLERCSSDCPYGFFAYKSGYGFLVSLRLADDSNHCAINNRDFNDRVGFQAGQHDLIVPTCMMISMDNAIQCALAFCNSTSLASTTQWVRYEDIGFELYA